MPLDEYQEVLLKKALTRNEKGQFPYSVIVWSDVKKSAKSTVAAAVALWQAWNTPWGSIKIIANDLKQADSRVSYYIRRAIELNPEMLELVKMRPSGYQIVFPNHAKIESVPVDPKGEAGGNDDGVYFSELWGAQNEAAQRLWTETTLSPTKFGFSFRWVETYAGYRGESPILEMLHEQGTKEGVLIPEYRDFDPPLEAWENKASRMLCLWNTVGRRPWHTREYYAQEAAVLAPEEFDRVHRNQWQSSVERFIPVEWWDSCAVDSHSTEPVYQKDQPHILALDASVSGDCFALVMLSGYDAMGLKIAVRYVNAYRPPKGGKIDFSEIEEEVRRLCKDYNVIEVVYDPYQMEDMAGRLKKDMLAHLYAFNQNAPRLIADKELQDCIRNRTIVHHGESVLREHLENANAKKQDDHKLRIVKRSEMLKIDAAVALSMALNRAKFWRL